MHNPEISRIKFETGRCGHLPRTELCEIRIVGECKPGGKITHTALRAHWSCGHPSFEGWKKRDEAKKKNGFPPSREWQEKAEITKSNVIATSAATAVFWLRATTFLLLLPQNRYRFGDDW